MVKIDTSAVGETSTGFQKAEGRGPFRCGNCVFYSHDLCSHPVMVAKSKQPKNKDGLVKVGDYDCCAYVRRLGDK